MRGLRQAVVLMVVLAIGGVFFAVVAQGPFRATEQQLEQIIVRLDSHSVSFRLSLTQAIANSFLNQAQTGDYLKSFVKEFGELTDRLHKRIKERRPVSSEVQEVLNRAVYLDSFVSSYELDMQAKSDWELIRADLDQLADYYSITTHWNTPEDRGIPQTNEVEALENRLIGTYKIDKERSNDVEKVVRRAVSELPVNQRIRLQISMMQRMRSPKLIAVDRDHDRIAFGSSLQSDRLFAVLAHAQTASDDRVPTLIFGGQFRFNTGQDADGLYSVTFSSINLGSRLQVTRTALLSHFKRPIVVTSYYTKISDSAQFNLSEEEDDKPFVGSGAGVRKKN